MTLRLPCPKCNIPEFRIPPPPALSPITPLLTNNDPPESHEEHIARQIIASSTTTLQNIAAILAEVDHVIDALKRRQHEHQEQIRLHQSVIAKLRHIPSDVLSEIFLHTVADQGDSRSWCEEVWTITQVCSRWRAAALSSPRLWSVLPGFDIKLRKGHHNHYRLQKCLERSGSVPLRLIIHFFELDPRDDHPFFGIVLPHFHRVAHLTLVSHCEEFPMLLNVLAFPWLKSIAFVEFNRSELENQHIAQTAPLLEELEISTGKPSSTLTDLQPISVQWHRLRKVSVNKIEFNCAISLLQVAIRLEECLVTLCPPKRSSTAPTPFSNKHLVRLCIGADSAGAVDKFLERANFPSLSKLSVESWVADFDCLSEFILRSSCTLTFLKLPLPFSPVAQDVLRLFSLLHEVTDLCITCPSFFRIDMVLKVDSQNSPLLPKLRHLNIIVTHSLAEVDPSAFRNTSSLAVLSGTVAAIDSIILQNWHPQQAACDKMFRLLDRWPETDIDPARVLLWNTQLRQMCVTREDGVSRTADKLYAADLGRIASELEAHGKIHAHLLIDTDIIDNLRHLLEQLGDNTDLQPLRQRLSAVLEGWSAFVHVYLNLVGWMKCGTDTLVYGKRRGSLTAKVVGKRSEDRFASFGVMHGGIIL